MKLSDYVSQFLVDNGIDHTFLVSGGGIMHLCDSFGRQEGMTYYCNYHEQACAIAAEGYVRSAGKPAVCLATVGPGAVNALAGIVGAWYDSLPMIVITGQVRKNITADFEKIRQLGPQEANVIPMAQPVTKMAKMVESPEDIKADLQEALATALEGRPGPTWLEIPLDIQGAEIDPDSLRDWTPPQNSQPELPVDQVDQLIEMISQAERPLFCVGNGLRIGGGFEDFWHLAEALEVPVTVPFPAKDLVVEDHPLNAGVFGTAGQRRANFAVQNCDLFVSFASGLNLAKVGFNYDDFAKKAKRVVIDIDSGQVFDQVVKPDLGIIGDVRPILKQLRERLEGRKIGISQRWKDAIVGWRKDYPIIIDDFLADKDHVNSYVFMDRLANHMAEGACVSVGNGLDCVSAYQAFKVKKGQSIVISGNWGSMGWDLPLAVGVCIGSGKQPTICVTGDGSFQWNVQELLTISHNQLPVKVCVFNNRGYSAIRSTQQNFSGGFFVGSDEGSGVGNPDFAKLAEAYRFKYLHIGNNDQLDQVLPQLIQEPSPVLCEVNIATSQWISPKASAFKREDGTFESRPLEDMAPFLPREEIARNMSLFDD